MIPLIVALAATAASAYAQNRAQKKVEAQRNKYQRQENARQEEFGKKAADINTATQDSFQRANQEQTLADAFAQRDKVMQEQAARPVSRFAAPVASNAPAVVGSEFARQVGKAAADARQQGTALARLRSFNDLGADNALNLMRASQDLGGVQRSSQISSDIFAREMQAAEQAGAKWRQISDLARMAGSFAGLYGMTGTAPTPPPTPTAVPTIPVTIPTIGSGGVPMPRFIR